MVSVRATGPQPTQEGEFHVSVHQGSGLLGRCPRRLRGRAVGGWRRWICRWIDRAGEPVRSTPRRWWAIGKVRPTGVFEVRRLVVGRLLARYEKRAGETIRPAEVIVT